MGYLENALHVLFKYKSLGDKILENKTHLIGKAPHIAPEAWLHTIYPPLSSTDIGSLEKELHKPLPVEYRTFLEHTNGLNVFNTTLYLFGLRRNYNRDLDNVWQPFDIILPNTIEAPPNIKENVCIIGGYDWDGSYLYINSTDGSVHLCKRRDSKSIFNWKSFPEMLESEVKRLVTLFDGNGQEINPDESTLPCDY